MVISKWEWYLIIRLSFWPARVPWHPIPFPISWRKSRDVPQGSSQCDHLPIEPIPITMLMYKILLLMKHQERNAFSPLDVCSCVTRYLNEGGELRAGSLRRDPYKTVKAFAKIFIVRSQCRFLVTSTDCYVRKSHLQRGLLSLMKEVLLSSW